MGTGRAMPPHGLKGKYPSGVSKKNLKNNQPPVWGVIPILTQTHCTETSLVALTRRRRMPCFLSVPQPTTETTWSTDSPSSVVMPWLEKKGLTGGLHGSESSGCFEASDLLGCSFAFLFLAAHNGGPRTGLGWKTGSPLQDLGELPSRPGAMEPTRSPLLS